MEPALEIAALDTGPTGHREQSHEVSSRDDTNQPTVPENRNASHASLHNEVGDRLSGGILADRDHVLTHHVCRDASTLRDQVELRNDTQNPPFVIDDWNPGDPMLHEQPRDLIDRRTRLDRDDVPRHDFVRQDGIDRVSHCMPPLPTQDLYRA